MPSLNEKFLLGLKEKYWHYPYFLETGTCTGATIFAMEPLFQNLYTIEISDTLYKETKSKYLGSKIKFIHGDSSRCLERILPKIELPCIFFLDGHYSSGNTGRGEKDCPLIEELIQIYNSFESKGIIIIDDVRLFGRCNEPDCMEDWSDISVNKVYEILNKRITCSYFLDSEYAGNDRMVIHIQPRNRIDAHHPTNGVISSKSREHVQIYSSDSGEFEVDWSKAIPMTEDLFLHPEKLNDIEFP